MNSREDDSKFIGEILNEVVRLKQTLIDLTMELIHTRSVNPRYSGVVYDTEVGGEGACARLLADTLVSIGLDAQVFGAEVGRENCGGILRGRGGGKSIVLNGHTDTVPPGDVSKWVKNPWSRVIENGEIFGLGATDMKGPIAAAVVAAMALKNVNALLRGDIVFQFVSGEETSEGEIGTIACVQKGYCAEAGICLEPTGQLIRGLNVLTLAPAAVGTLVFRVCVIGRTAHAATRRESIYPTESSRLGIGAFEKGLVITSALSRLEQAWGFTKQSPVYSSGSFTINPGVVHAYTEGNPSAFFIADRFMAEYVAFYPPEEKPDDVKRQITACIASAASQDEWLSAHPPIIEWMPSIPAAYPDPSHPIITDLSAAIERVTGRSAILHGLRGGCDAAWLCANDIPTIVYGPGNIASAHTYNESIAVSELIEASQTLALLMLRFCS